MGLGSDDTSDAHFTPGVSAVWLMETEGAQTFCAGNLKNLHLFPARTERPDEIMSQ